MGSVSRDPTDLQGTLNQTGLHLLRRALSDQPSERPSMHEWYRYWNSVMP
jgi:hypothetical protein